MADWLAPEWPAPANVRAAISTRRGGVSGGPWRSNNLALQVGDNAGAVVANRRALRAQLALAAEPQWLSQIHGVRVLAAKADGRVRRADGAHTCEVGLACAVLTADCLPVLLCDRAGRQVAAIHAGWRGLAKGILSRALARFAAEPGQLLAYLGPAISQPHFEVGEKVRRAFLKTATDDSHRSQVISAFLPAERPGHYYADLYALARADLAARGVTAVYGGDHCTYTDSQRFYSYRRDQTTGRFASLIWKV